MEAWGYRCSLCRVVVALGDVRSHMASHQIRPDWQGAMTYTRVDCCCPGVCEVPGHPGSIAAAISRRL